MQLLLPFRMSDSRTAAVLLVRTVSARNRITSLWARALVCARVYACACTPSSWGRAQKAVRTAGGKYMPRLKDYAAEQPAHYNPLSLSSHDPGRNHHSSCPRLFVWIKRAGLEPSFKLSQAL